MTNWAAGMDVSAPRLIASTWSDINTYTPTASGTGSISFSVQTGSYFTAGSLVYVSIYMIVGTGGTGTADVQIRLPIAPDRSARQIIPGFMQGGVSGNNGTAIIQCNTSGSGTLADRTAAKDNTDIIGNMLQSGTFLTFQGIYLAA